MFDFDRVIFEFDRALRTLTGSIPSTRPAPSRKFADPALSKAKRGEAEALMRVNHCGEVCAQALYSGQAFTSSNKAIQNKLRNAAHEEQDHLAWSQERIRELNGRTSLLNPVWYAGSWAIGAIAGSFGDKWNLGFLRETERQVERHLEGHLDRLDPADARTRAIVEVMKQDESAHARSAARLGAAELPRPVKAAMRAASKVMTSVSYWV